MLFQILMHRNSGLKNVEIKFKAIFLIHFSIFIDLIDIISVNINAHLRIKLKSHQ